MGKRSRQRQKNQSAGRDNRDNAVRLTQDAVILANVYNEVLRKRKDYFYLLNAKGSGTNTDVLTWLNLCSRAAVTLFNSCINKER